MKKGVCITIVVVAGMLLAITSVAFSAANAISPGWIQVNENGFGDARNSAQSLEVFAGKLYAGTWSNDYLNFAAQIWRSADGKNWNQVTPSWAVANSIVFDLQEFNSQLYAGLANDDGGEVWRSSDGSTWERVVSGGFGDTLNYAAHSLAVYSDTIIAATSNITTGVEIWSSPTGNSGEWAQVNADGFGGGPTWQDVTMDVYNEHIYVGIGRDNGAELWRSDDGKSWSPLFTNGLGNSDNTSVSSMESYNGDFYIGLRNTEAGGEIWRWDGTSWTTVFTGGNGDPDNQRPYGLTEFNGKLYLTMINESTGASVWESSDGLSWQVIADNGWGDSGNFYADYFDKGHAIFNGGLYFATHHSSGGEIWLYLSNKVYLPLGLK